MPRIQFLDLRKTPIWVPFGAAALALCAAALHPEVASGSLADFLSETVGGDTIEYLAYALGSFSLFWVICHRWLAKRQLSRRRWPRFAQVKRELLFSLCAQFTMTGIGVWLTFGTTEAVSNLYPNIADYGWGYFALFVFALFVIDDTTFYWSHRLMHHPRLYRAFHRVHHESVDPTPFTAYSFHPLEAAMLSLGSLAMMPLLMFLPWHPLALVVFGIGNISFNVIGHLGYELYPRGWNRIPVLRWKTPALHHYLHHQMVGGNYGLYFRWWDKMCGTEIAGFEARYDRLFASPASTRPPHSLHSGSTAGDQSNPIISNEKEFSNV